MSALLAPLEALLGRRQAIAVVDVLIPTPLKDVVLLGLNLARDLGVVVSGLVKVLQDLGLRR
jgi:hypothetical protein